MSFNLWIASLKDRFVDALNRRRTRRARLATLRQGSLEVEPLEDRLRRPHWLVNSASDNTTDTSH